MRSFWTHVREEKIIRVKTLFRNVHRTKYNPVFSVTTLQMCKTDWNYQLNRQFSSWKLQLIACILIFLYWKTYFTRIVPRGEIKRESKFFKNYNGVLRKNVFPITVSEHGSETICNGQEGFHMMFHNLEGCKDLTLRNIYAPNWFLSSVLFSMICILQDFRID